jgi:isopenicillin N synthase-like dioxygenase
MSLYTASHALHDNELAAGPPVIDVSPLLTPGKAGKEKVIQDISKAATTWGFFQATGHGVPEADIDVFDQSFRRFFGRERAFKYQSKRTADNSRGYFDDELTKQTLDWKEAIDIGAQDGSLDGRSSVDGFNQWPVDDDNFRRDVQKYFGHMTNLSRTLCQALALGLGERADFFDALFAKHTSYLRINHYPPCPSPVASDFPLHSPDPKTEGYLGINRHTDAGVLTVRGLSRHKSSY